MVSLNQRAARFGFETLSVIPISSFSRSKRRHGSTAFYQFIRQARQELNPQHPLLESGALPN
jgi:hypothetical protein